MEVITWFDKKCKYTYEYNETELVLNCIKYNDNI